MTGLPPSVQVFAWVALLVMIALAFGFRLKTKFRADDTIYEGIVADLKRVNERVRTLTEQLDTERRERHEETTTLRGQINGLQLGHQTTPSQRINPELCATVIAPSQRTFYVKSAISCLRYSAPCRTHKVGLGKLKAKSGSPITFRAAFGNHF